MNYMYFLSQQNAINATRRRLVNRTLIPEDSLIRFAPEVNKDGKQRNRGQTIYVMDNFTAQRRSKCI